MLLTVNHLAARQAPEQMPSGRPQLVWQGKLQGTHDLIVQKNSVRVEDVSGPPLREVQYRFVTPLPATEVTVDVDPRVSRGWVHVMQQPTMDNGYALRVRIEDRQSGEYFYSLAVTWRALYSQNDDFLTKSRRPTKSAAPRDAAWVANGERVNVSCGAIWSGVVNGRARIAVSGREARVVQGQGSGDLDVLAGTGWPKGAYHPVVMATSPETRVNVVEKPSAENDYTLIIDVLAERPAARIEIAW